MGVSSPMSAVWNQFSKTLTPSGIATNSGTPVGFFPEKSEKKLCALAPRRGGLMLQTARQAGGQGGRQAV